MKSFIALAIIALALGAMLTGCSKNEASTNTNNAPKQAYAPTPQDDAVVNAAVSNDTSDVQLGSLV